MGVFRGVEKVGVTWFTGWRRLYQVHVSRKEKGEKSFEVWMRDEGGNAGHNIF